MTNDAFTSQSCLRPPHPHPHPQYPFFPSERTIDIFPGVSFGFPSCTGRLPTARSSVSRRVAMHVVFLCLLFFERVLRDAFTLFFCNHGLDSPIRRSLCSNIVIIITAYHTGDRITPPPWRAFLRLFSPKWWLRKHLLWSIWYFHRRIARCFAPYLLLKRKSIGEEFLSHVCYSVSTCP